MKIKAFFLAIAILVNASFAVAAKNEASYKPVLKPLSKIVVFGALTTVMKTQMTIEEGEYLVKKMQKTKLSPFQPTSFKPVGEDGLQIQGMKGILKFKNNGHAIEYNGVTFTYNPDMSFDKTVEKFEKQLRGTRISSLFIPSAEAQFTNCGPNDDCIPNSSLAIAITLNAVAKYRAMPGSDDNAKFQQTLNDVAQYSAGSQALMAAGTEALVSNVSCERDHDNKEMPYILIKYRNGATGKIFCSKEPDHTSVTIWSTQANGAQGAGSMQNQNAKEMKELFMNYCGVNIETGEMEKDVLVTEREKLLEGLRSIQRVPMIQNQVRDRTGITQ